MSVINFDDIYTLKANNENLYITSDGILSIGGNKEFLIKLRPDVEYCRSNNINMKDSIKNTYWISYFSIANPQGILYVNDIENGSYITCSNTLSLFQFNNETINEGEDLKLGDKFYIKGDALEYLIKEADCIKMYYEKDLDNITCTPIEFSLHKPKGSNKINKWMYYAIIIPLGIFLIILALIIYILVID